MGRDTNEKGPLAVRGDDGKTGGFNDHVDPSHTRRRRQPPPSETKRPALRRYACSFCGELRPDEDLVGRDRALRFCSRCTLALDGLSGAPVDALMILRGNP